MKILIVDDKEEACYLLEQLMKSKGHEVVTSENGKKALIKINEQKFNLIISDILMPEMDGFQFCKILKGDPALQNIPFVFYTATYIDEKDEEFALKLGADLFLRKPMQPELFVEEIERLLVRFKESNFQPLGLKIQNEEDIFKMYSERLIKKLEDKVFQLEAEIEKRTEVEKKLRTLIQEREVLLREIYHRTRNNMQVISSLLQLYSNKLVDSKGVTIIEKINNKISTIALVHQKLYESNDLSHLDLKDYFESLIKIVSQKHNKKNKAIKFELDLQKIYVLLDTAIPMGFVLNELITNSFEHAFPGKKEGTIKVHLSFTDDKTIFLRVKDNGIGISREIDFNNPNNMGLMIAVEMIKKQLHGVVEYKNVAGLEWTITATQEGYSKRV